MTNHFTDSTASDLAEERHESSFADGAVRFSQYEKDGVRVSDLLVLSDEGEARIGRAAGRYVTVSFPDTFYLGAQSKKSISTEIGKALAELAPHGAERILIAGLGNRYFTSDSIGVLIAEGVEATPPEAAALAKRAAAIFIPGTEGQTGLKTAALVKNAAECFRADLVIVADAVAAKDTARLLRTVELCDTGIAPGSGIGARQTALCEATVGVPTIGIGIPTVTRSAAFAEAVSLSLASEKEAANAAAQRHAGYFVVPKRLDYGVRAVASLVCHAIDDFIFS